MPVHFDLSVISLVHNAEACLAKILQRAEDLRAQISPQATFELLFFDHNSTDNSLSALQLLSRRAPTLRIFAHTRQGSAIKRGSRCARGDHWIILDGLPSPQATSWTLEQLLAGKRGASVDGKVLGVSRAQGIQALSWHQGGLWAAQRTVHQMMRKEKQTMVRHGWSSKGPLGEIRLQVQGRWSQLVPKLRKSD